MNDLFEITNTPLNRGIKSMDSKTIINILKLSRGISYAAIFIYLLGALFALVIGAPFDAGKLILGYAILFTGTLGGMYTNSYYDVVVDKLSTQTAISGGSRVLAEHPELRKTIRLIMLSLFSLSIILGLVFTILYSYPVTFIAFIVVSNFIAWQYTAPPMRLVYRGLGEFATLLILGVFMVGFGYFVVRGTIDLSYALYSIPFMLFGFAFSFFVEIADRNADLQGHKITMVVRRNERFGFIMGTISVAGAMACFLLFYLLQVFPVSVNFLVLALITLIPVVIGALSLRKYIANPTTMISMATRSSVSTFLVFILIDAYFIYALLI
jgi:1,4-dihydroxy-2-naphthoate polyprenyltransferase